MNGIELRTLRPDELQQWLDFLCRDVFPQDPREAVESLWHTDGRKDFSGVFVAVDGTGNIVGSVKAECRDISICGEMTPAAIISGVGTRRDMRGRGIAMRLFDMCRAYMLENGARVAHLYSRPDTLDFYRRMGFGALPQRAGEDFYRMYMLISPFAPGGVLVADTQTLIRLL